MRNGGPGGHLDSERRLGCGVDVRKVDPFASTKAKDLVAISDRIPVVED